jgi:hypothetical protein
MRKRVFALDAGCLVRDEKRGAYDETPLQPDGVVV